jgi:hypothetical protein
MHRHRLVFTGLALAACVAATPARAAVFCVATPLALSQALLTAESNAQDDTIRLVVGTYSLSSEIDYYGGAGETYKLTILGGFDPGCASGNAAADATVLDGQDTTRIFTISAAGEVDIGRITFAHGKPTQYFGGALSVSTLAGEIYLFDNVFASNQSPSGAAGGALYIQVPAAHSGYLWSNLFLANTSSGGGAVYAYNQGNLYITGNTVVANSLLNHTGIGGGLDITGNGHYWLTNNILWNNEATDVYDQAGHADYANNDIGTKDGFAPLSETNELSVDPGFAGFFSFRPGPASPMINAGLDAAPGGVGGCCDVSGASRVVGKHVDIGAYESDVLFRNGFEG